MLKYCYVNYESQIKIEILNFMEMEVLAELDQLPTPVQLC